MKKTTTLFLCAMALAVCAGAAAAAGLDMTAMLSPDAAALGLTVPSTDFVALLQPDANSLGALAAAGAAGMAKITVKSPTQLDAVTYSEGRHDVSDDVAKRLVQAGAAEEGWNVEEGPLSQAGTQNPPGQADPAGGGDQGTADSGDTSRTSRRSPK